MAAWFADIAIVGSLLAGAALVLTILLFRSLKARIEKLALDASGKEELAALTGALRDQMISLEQRLTGLEQQRNEHAEWISQSESLHLNRRGQVLRLHRRGDSVPEIASALRVAQGEVKLMVKVHELSRG